MILARLGLTRRLSFRPWTDRSAFPSQAWFDAFRTEINASDEYREAAAEWEGDIAFLIKAEPDRGVPADVWGWLDLWHGECRGAGLIDEARASDAAYGITAPYTRWKDVLLGDLDPIKGMMQGKLKVRATCRRSCGRCGRRPSSSG